MIKHFKKAIISNEEDQTPYLQILKTEFEKVALSLKKQVKHKEYAQFETYSHDKIQAINLKLENN